MADGTLKLWPALQLVGRTLPMVGIRLGVSLLSWLATLLYVLGVAALVARIAGHSAWLGAVVAVAAAVGLVFLARLAYRRVLCPVKAAQIAVTARLLTGQALPSGVSQLQWGREQVASRFGEVDTLYQVERLVSPAVGGWTELVYGLIPWLPGGSLRGLARPVGRAVRYAAHYVDGAILARALSEDDGTVWANARDGVVLYASAWRPLLTEALALAGLSLIPGLVALLLFLAPVGWLVRAIWSPAGGWSILAALALGWVFKVALGDSYAMAAMVAAYRDATRGLRPDPQMLNRLSHVAPFEELHRRAEQELAQQHLHPRPAGRS